MPTPSMSELAVTLGTTPERLRTVVKQRLSQLPRTHYYVFRITSEQRASAPARNEPRMIAAFPTPDDALAFAQRNGYGSNAQLRSVAAADLLLRMLTDPNIGTILFVRDNTGETERGFGPALKLKRANLVAELQVTSALSATEAAELANESPDQALSYPLEELTAQHYDALQFGVNFTLRAEFRVALAQAVEQVVDAYRPPVGSVDTGPRSIFATAAVEAWLKEHGFPHAYQRRWIDVADDPAWGGAVELCEIDGGTANRLLVQLAIHEDASGRQYINRVNVTA